MRRETRLALAFIGGFCDTSTFTHVHHLFCAHITGNFVVLAASLTKLEPFDYNRLLAFPFFIIGITIGTIVYGDPKSKNKIRPTYLPRLSGILLCLAGASALALSLAWGTTALGAADSIIAMMMITAMGLQNSFHRFVSGPMTTVMTGNIVHLISSTVQRLRGYQEQHSDSIFDDKPFLLTALMIFAIGCIGGAYITSAIGLTSILLPGLIMLGLSFYEAKRA